MKRISLIIVAMIALCVAVGRAAPPDTLTLQDLVNHPERWPDTVSLSRDLQSRNGAVLHKGDKMHVEMFDGQHVGVSGNNVRVKLAVIDCDLLDAANKAWAALTPAQRAVDPQTIAADPSLWPIKVKLPDGLKSQFGDLPSGAEAELFTIDADGPVVVVPNSKNRVGLDMAHTDVFEQARALAALDPDKRPSRIIAALTPVLVDADGKPFHDDHLADKKYFAFYYGAGWCPPCRAFSPDFIKWANTALQAHPELEIVFMSNDKANAGMTDYMKEEKMPFPAVLPKDVNASALLVGYAADMIPHLIVVDRFGKVLVNSDPNGQRVDDIMKQTVPELDKLLNAPKPQ